MSSLELSCQQLPRRSLFIRMAPGLRAKEKAWGREGGKVLKYFWIKIFSLYLVKTRTGPSWGKSSPDPLDPVLVEAVVKDGVHVAPLIRPVEDNLVAPRAQLDTLRLVPRLHVAAADILKHIREAVK